MKSLGSGIISCFSWTRIHFINTVVLCLRHSRWIPTCRRNIFLQSWTLKIEAACSSEMSTITNQTTCCHNPDFHNTNLDRFQNKIIQLIHLRIFTCYCCLDIYIALLKKFFCALQNALRHTTPCSIVLVGKLIVVQRVKNSPTFYATWRFFTNSQESATDP
jgi:hypothetical protein